MKKSLLNLTVTALLATASSAALAGTATIPHSFKADEKAVADQVNANFTAVKAAVDANATDIATNASVLTDPAGAVGTNTTGIAANTASITANTASITALQGTGGACPDDMVASGTICVDKHEASVWDAATEGTQIVGLTSTTTGVTCVTDGSDCVAGGVAPIYARSVPDVEPAYELTYYQAAVACANVGKRLPTAAEWQMAAMGTASGNGDGTAAQCNNIAGGAGILRNTSLAASCVSAAGAYNMVGNLYEMTADMHFGGIGAPPHTTDSAAVVAFGHDFKDNGSTKSIKDAYIINPDSTGNWTTGFRCVK